MARSASVRRRLRPLVGFLTVLVVLLVVWETIKFIGGDTWHIEDVLGTGVTIDHDPPLTFAFATDVKLPHIWDIAAEFGNQDAAGATTVTRLVGAALFTLRNAAIGFLLGSTIGMLLAILLVHVRVLERALVPLIVASQTISALRRISARATATVIAVSLLIAGCGGTTSTASPARSAGPPEGSASPSAAGPRTPTPTDQLSLTPVRVQLRWALGAEFAGYVAAIDQGYFESEGLDVTLVEGGPDLAPEVAGSAIDGPEFTVSWVPRVLTARATATSDLVDIGQFFHRSSTLTMAFRDQEVTAPADFKGKKVGVLPGGDRLEVTAAMRRAGVDPEAHAQLADLGAGVDPLLTGQVDVAQVTIHDTYARVLEATDRRTGKPYQTTDFDVINLDDEGTAMLQDAVFTRASWLAREGHEAIATSFLKAAALGWMYCRDHPSDCVDSVVAAGETIRAEPGASASPPAPSPSASPATRLRPGHEAWGMNEVNPLIWPSPAGVGVMVADEWQHTISVLMTSGALAAQPGDEAYRTDLMESALEALGDVDTKGDAFIKGTVEIEPEGG